MVKVRARKDRAEREVVTVRVVVFGATGPTGRLVVDQALAAGHAVVAAVRRPDRLAPAPGLTVVRSDVTEPATVDAAVAGAGAGADAVVSVLGVGFTKQPVTLMSEGTAHVVAAMRAHGVRRLLAVSSVTMEPDRAHPSGGLLFDRVFEPFAMRLGRTVYEDLHRTEDLVRASGLDWTLVRPCGLFDLPAPTAYTLTEDRAVGLYTARADLAAAMVAQLAADRFVRRAMAVTTTAVKPSILKLIWREGVARKPAA